MRALAQAFARRGWPVHPLAPGRKTPAANCTNCRETATLPSPAPASGKDGGATADTVLWAAGDLAENIADRDQLGRFTMQALDKHRARTMSTAGMNAMLTQARSAPGMVLKADRLDADPYALCTPAASSTCAPDSSGTPTRTRTSTPAPPPSDPSRPRSRAGCAS